MREIVRLLPSPPQIRFSPLGTLHGRWIKKSLGIRNWESAQTLVREWESGKATKIVMLSEAFSRFLADCEARKLSPETIYKYRILEKEMLPLWENVQVGAISIDDLSIYRESWKLGALTARNKIERLRRFFNFCVERGWSERNPAKLLKAPKNTGVPTLPFTDAEITKILAAVEQYPDRPKGRREQVWAFVLLLQHSGLRIRDAVCLTKDKISDGKLMLYTQKTGQVVSLPLPVGVVDSLDGLPFNCFWSGNGSKKSGVASWERSLKMLFKVAAVKGAHAHRFRDYFAVNLLKHGVSLEDVAILLGHSSLKITEKHYAPWVKVRQVRLEESVRSTWSS